MAPTGGRSSCWPGRREGRPHHLSKRRPSSSPDEGRLSVKFMPVAQGRAHSGWFAQGRDSGSPRARSILLITPHLYFLLPLLQAPGGEQALLIHNSVARGSEP